LLHLPSSGQGITGGPGSQLPCVTVALYQPILLQPFTSVFTVIIGSQTYIVIGAVHLRLVLPPALWSEDSSNRGHNIAGCNQTNHECVSFGCSSNKLGSGQPREADIRHQLRLRIHTGPVTFYIGLGSVRKW